MPTSYEKLSALLKELFQLDQADLDFGIYRIMNQKRDEITRFLDHDLLPQVKSSFDQYRPADKKVIEGELQKAILGAQALGMDPDLVPKVKEIREQLATYAVDTGALENEVYSHLYSFFRRYYDNGDFISMRRYKEGVYAIPYEGEEVKLHWANADQYYVKTTENFRDYAFRLPSGRLAHFKIVEAETEKDNVKADADKERRFILAPENPIVLEGDTLILRFEYRADPEKRDQKTLNALAVEAIQAAAPADWSDDVQKLAPSEANPRRSLLEKHLADYTARNTFDYFIHKDLGGFLRRELDFYIKNEVMRLDDIENENAPRVEQYLSKIKALRQIAQKIIEFLAQIENFQKKLWLKKKFVVETNYCITLDRVPEALYPDICANDAQREEWVRLFAIDKITGDLVNPGYSAPLHEEFLKANPLLVIDTALFPTKFKEFLLSSIENIEKSLNGILIKSENFQGLNLISKKNQLQISTIYIDPPFNLGSNASYLYRTDYKDSTWLTLLDNRLQLALNLLQENGFFFIRCDYHGPHFIRQLIESYGLEIKAEIVIDRSRNEAGSANKMEITYEHLFMIAKSDFPINKFTVQRSLANIKWTGFLMAGDRNPPERNFLGKVIYPPKGQHFALRQEKVDKLLGEFHLRLRCSKCGAYFYKAISSQALEVEMKKINNRFKFYDIFPQTIFFGVNALTNCLSCGSDSFKVDYLGSDEVFINDRWIDVPSYSRRWDFLTENSEELLNRVFEFNEGLTLDYFAGSGTSAAVSIKKGRKCIAIEMGDQFNAVIIPRIKAVLNGEKSGISGNVNWKGGGCIKYSTLESYEDTLNNLTLRCTQEQQLALEANPEFKENYMLSYMLDVESQGSLLNIQSFVHPFDYRLNIAAGTVGESQPTKIDLVETFNYLIGLRVQTQQSIRGFRVVTGLTPAGDRTLIIWRDLEEKSNADLEEFFRKQDYNPRDMEFDLIYVNGDNNLENLRRPDETWKVRLIEEDFLRLMFEES